MTTIKEANQKTRPQETCRTPSNGIEGALLRVGTSTGGGAAVGAVLGSIVFPGVGTVVGAALGSMLGLTASTHDAFKSSRNE
jgi:hypothetical protein